MAGPFRHSRGAMSNHPNARLPGLGNDGGPAVSGTVFGMRLSQGPASRQAGAVCPGGVVGEA
jgi:hypothetical protein